MNLSFIADVHLGKLAAMLRMLGVDTAYSNSISTAELIQSAKVESRILLSKNAFFMKHQPALQLFVIRYDFPLDQLKQVTQHFNLLEKINPFSRCLVCNGLICPVLKENIEGKLPLNTAKYYNEFWQCDHCKRIYWKGPHYIRMLSVISKLKEVS